MPEMGVLGMKPYSVLQNADVLGKIFRTGHSKRTHFNVDFKENNKSY